jgi:lysophospholipase L1-like esterase
VTTDIAAQLERLPAGTSHLIVSVGGNDALGFAAMLNEPARSVSEVIGRLADARQHFHEVYRQMIALLVDRDLSAAICTIYDANYGPDRGPLVTTALTVFNDIITRCAFDAGLDLIDLRLICTEPGDYANPIEPSIQGGGKIAARIADYVAQARRPGGRSSVWR